MHRLGGSAGDWEAFIHTQTWRLRANVEFGFYKLLQKIVLFTESSSWSMKSLLKMSKHSPAVEAFI